MTSFISLKTLLGDIGAYGVWIEPGYVVVIVIVAVVIVVVIVVFFAAFLDATTHL